MALDFPPGTPGATYTGPNGVIWSWDGAKWLAGTSANVYAPIASPAFSGNPTAPTPPVGDADTSLATTQFVSDAVATSLHDVGRNYIHNSMFNVAQRGVGPFTVNSLYTLDRWFLSFNLDTNNSITQQAVAPGGVAGDEACLFVLANTGFVGNVGAASYSIMTQFVEDVRRLGGKTVTVSFYAYGSASQKLGVSLDQLFGTGGSPSGFVAGSGQSVTLSTTWTRYSLTFALATVSGKTLGTNNNSSTGINFWYSSGTGQAARAGSIGVQSGSVSLWGVQLELGPTATPLEKLDPVTQLQQCQRFYQSSWAGMGGYGTAGMTANYVLPLPVPLRAVGTTYAAVAPSYVNCSGGTVGPFGSGANISVNVSVTAVGQFSFYLNYTASADL